MNKNKKMLFLLGGLCIVAIILFVLFIKFNMNDSTEEKETEPTVNVKIDKEKIEEHHEMIDDPFMGTDGTIKKSAKISGLTFKTPHEITDYPVQEGTMPIILGVSNKYMIVKSFGDILHIYNFETKKKIKIADHVDHAIISDDNQFVFYSTKEAVFQYDIGRNVDNGVIVMGPPASTMESFVYHNGLLFYTFIDGGLDGDPYRTESFVLPRFMSSYTTQQVTNNIDNTTPTLTLFNNEFYYFDKATNSVEKIALGGGHQTAFAFPTKVASPSKIEANANGDWLVLDYDESTYTVKVQLSNGTVTGFESITDASWYDAERLVVLSDTNLYLYNVKTGKKEGVEYEVSHYKNVQNGNIVYVPNKEIISVIEKRAD